MNRVALADLMTRDFVGVSEADDIEAAARTMRDAGEDIAVVLRGRDPVGVVTTGAALDHFTTDSDGEQVGDIMEPVPPSLRPEATIDDATTAFSQMDTETLLVTDSDGVLGVVTARDVATLPREPADAEELSPTVTSETEGGAVVAEEPDSYSSQSICESCGSLAQALTDVNGQLLCVECKRI